MKQFMLLSLLVVLFSCCGSAKKNTDTKTSGIYNFKAKSIQGDEINLKDYKGKVLLIVNTASKCGYTKQFAGLEELYEKYRNDGLVILGFPSNQFGGQDPGSNEEILEFCQANYGVTFPMFEKIDVNGENASPIYSFLKNNVPDTEPADIKWNFTKFLVGKDGKPMKRYEPKVTPTEIESEIRSALKADM